MPLPKPVPGLVIRYSFLWSHEAKAGSEDGSKDRPCAILLATMTRNSEQIVTVLPVTHAPPADERMAVEIPAGTTFPHDASVKGRPLSICLIHA
jgi:hypothetical protein